MHIDLHANKQTRSWKNFHVKFAESFLQNQILYLSLLINFNASCLISRHVERNIPDIPLIELIGILWWNSFLKSPYYFWSKNCCMQVGLSIEFPQLFSRPKFAPVSNMWSRRAIWLIGYSPLFSSLNSLTHHRNVSALSIFYSY